MKPIDICEGPLVPIPEWGQEKRDAEQRNEREIDKGYPYMYKRHIGRKLYRSLKSESHHM